jgi:foldase protein PrsA
VRPVPKPRHLILTIVLCASLGLVACGGSRTATHAATQSATAKPAQSRQAVELTIPSTVAPREIVAQVGATPITWAAVVHQMSLANHGAPLPDPPSYSACVNRARVAAANAGNLTAQPSEAALEQNCGQEYRRLLEDALVLVIHHQWMIGQAAEAGVEVSSKEVSAEFQTGKKLYGAAEYEKTRRRNGQSIADVMGEIRLDKLTAGIFGKLAKKEHPISSAEVESYYETHLQQFAIPQGRAVRIVRTATRSSAARVLQELKAGKSFASVAKELSQIGQPIGAKNGEVADLKPGVYEQKRLNNAIFGAKLNQLYGPLELTATHKTIAPETNTGFFIYEVKGITPAGHVPLSEIKVKLAKELAEEQRARIVPPFIRAYRRRWKARTNCRPGFVVSYCSQHKTSKAEEEIDPYTL